MSVYGMCHGRCGGRKSVHGRGQPVVMRGLVLVRDAVPLERGEERHARGVVLVHMELRVQ